MNEKTELLLQSLAEKLGTTTEYLWVIIVNQAKYDAITSVIQMAFMFAIIFWTIKLHIRFSTEDENGDTMYYNKEEYVIVPMIFAAITSIIMLVFFLSGFNDLIAAIFNPEYWALNRILKAI
jgi:hypothetical protein